MSAPQHCSSLTSTTSMPWRVSTIDGGLVDARRQHLLGAALQQRDPPAPRADWPGKRCRAAGPGGGRLSGASASIALIRRSRVGDRRRLRRRQQGRERPAEPRQDHARRETASGRGSTRTPARRAAAVRSAAANSPVRSGPAPGRRDACSSRPTDRWSCRRGRTGSGRCA